jgi:hypothetical protein
MTVLVSLLAAMLPTAALAQDGARSPGESAPGEIAQNQSPSTPDPSDLPAASARAAAARLALAQAETDLNLAVIRLQANFAASPDYRSAADELHAAQAVFDAARSRVAQTLASDDAYQELLSRRDRVGDVLEKDQAILLPIDRLQLSQRKMDYAREASEWENNAMDQNADVTAARQRLAAAATRVRELREKFDAGIPLDPTWQGARAAAINLRVATAAADAYLATAIQSHKDALDAQFGRDAYVNSYPYAVAQTAANDPGYGYGYGYYNAGFGYNTGYIYASNSVYGPYPIHSRHRRD